VRTPGIEISHLALVATVTRTCQPDRDDIPGATMDSPYRCINAGAVVLEPQSIWVVEDAAARRARLLKLVRGRIGGGAPDDNPEDERAQDARLRLADMALDGVDATFLFPGRGLAVDMAQAPAGAFRACNRWIAEYCAYAPDRLFGAALVPPGPVDAACAELAHAHDALGLCTVSLRPGTQTGVMLADPAYAAFWQAVEERGMAVAVHDAGQGRIPEHGPWPRARASAEMRTACGAIIGGLCARHPRLRIGFLETGGAWIIPWLRQSDERFERLGLGASGEVPRPSDIFQRNCWIAADPLDGSLQALVEYLGAHKLLWASGQPHPVGFHPGTACMVRQKLAGMSAQAMDQVMAGGARAFYGLD